MVTVSLGEVRPQKAWLEPCIEIECEISCELEECVVGVTGLLKAEDDKVLTVLSLSPMSARTPLCRLMAGENHEYNSLRTRGERQHISLTLVAPLTYRALEHIEELREKRPKRDVILKLALNVLYLKSRIVTSHLHEVKLSQLPDNLRTALNKLKVGSRQRNPDSILVYSYDDDFSTTRTNMWILSADGGATFLEVNTHSTELVYRISSDDWIHDFLPILSSKRIVTLEVPVIERPEVGYEHLTMAIDELKRASNFFREGRYDSVIMSLRNVLMNHLLMKCEGEWHLMEEVKRIALAGVPEAVREEYEEALKGLEGSLRRILKHHLSKFVHIDSGKLLMMPLREDAEYLLLTVTAAAKYLSDLSARSREVA